MEKNQLQSELKQAADKKQFAVVEILSINAIENYPNEEFGYYYQAVCRMQRGNYTEAKESLNKIKEFNSNHIDAILLSCEINRAEENIEAWGENVNQLLELDNENINVLFWAARYNVYNFENDTALSYVNAALAKESNELGYKIRAEIYQNTAQYELALSDLEQCQRFAPQNQLIIKQKIAINTLLANNIEIEADYRRLLNLDSTNIDNKVSFAYFLSKIEQYAAAETFFTEAVIAVPDSEEFIMERAVARYHLERYEEALEDVETALMYNSKNENYHILLAKIRLAMYDIQEAIDGLSGAIEKGVNEVSKLYYYRGEILFTESDYIRAAEDFKISATNNDYAGKSFFYLGKCYLEQSELQLAYESWKAADAAYHPDAEDMINTYCTAQVAEQAVSIEAGLVFMYEGEVENNRNSRFVKMLTGKVWKFAEDTTANKNPIFKELPKDMQEPLLDAFNKMVLTVSPSGIFIMNPEQTDMRAVYRIDKEEGNEVWLMSQPLTGASERLFKISYEDKSLSLDGFAEDMEFKLYFRPAPNGLSDKEKKAYAKRKESGQVTFMGEGIVG